MTCSQFLDRYSDYDDSLLGPGELSEFRAHLRACPSCARYDRVLRKGRMVARQVAGPEPDRDFTVRLRQRLVWSARRRAGAAPGPVLPSYGTAAMAAVTILLVASSALTLLERVAGPDGERGTEGEVAAVVAVERAGTGAGAPSSPGIVVPVALEGRSVVLPSSSPRVNRAWAVERVDRRLASSYSPLVTGPPAYRAARAYLLGPTTPTRRTLD